MKVKLNEHQLQKIVEWLKLNQNVLSEDLKPYYEIDSPTLRKIKTTNKIPKPAIAMRKRGRPRKNPLITPDEIQYQSDPITNQLKKRGRPKKNVDFEGGMVQPEKINVDNIAKTLSRGRPVDTEKVIDKFKTYLNRGIFTTQQLNDLGEIILDFLSKSPSK